MSETADVRQVIERLEAMASTLRRADVECEGYVPPFDDWVSECVSLAKVLTAQPSEVERLECELAKVKAVRDAAIANTTEALRQIGDLSKSLDEHRGDLKEHPTLAHQLRQALAVAEAEDDGVYLFTEVRRLLASQPAPSVPHEAESADRCHHCGVEVSSGDTVCQRCFESLVVQGARVTEVAVPPLTGERLAYVLQAMRRVVERHLEGARLSEDALSVLNSLSSAATDEKFATALREQLYEMWDRGRCWAREHDATLDPTKMHQASAADVAVALRRLGQPTFSKDGGRG
jgi:hypothetical protein